jgi:predicted ribonuclease YlaK
MKFYDTCSLLDLQKEVFKEKFYVSSITFVELEGIKTSLTKDEETKISARKLIRLLAENNDKYEVILYNLADEELIKTFGLASNNDSRIIVGASRTYLTHPDLVFVTSDLACKVNAESVGLPTEYTFLDNVIKDEYCGYKEITMTDEELVNFYSFILPKNINQYQLLENEYLLILNTSGEVIDKYCWKNSNYIKIAYQKFESRMFGRISPMKNDPYQSIAIDALKHNQITLLRGPAGSGKSMLALASLFEKLEGGEIDKIIIFCNPVVTRGAAKLGFYPGDKNDKLLDSQIGNFLIGKLGSITEVEKMLDEETLLLVPVGDCRGMDTNGKRAGCYITEAQNTTADMMKLILQRVGEDCIMILDGDDLCQVDLKDYSGNNNGLRRTSQTFRGEDIYSEVTLKNIYRSRIAQIAERM